MRLALLVAASALIQPDPPHKSREAQNVLEVGEAYKAVPDQAARVFLEVARAAHLRAEEDLACPLQQPLCDLRGPDGDVVPCKGEALSQYMYAKWIPETARVLELGARFGQSTCMLQRLVSGQGSVVAVEPDVTAWGALGRNLKANGCEAQVVRQIRAEWSSPEPGVGALTLAATATTPEIASVSGAEFTPLGEVDTLAVDCVGCFAQFYRDNPALFNSPYASASPPLQRIIVRKVEESNLDEQLALRTLVEGGWSVAEGVAAVQEGAQRVIPSMVLCRPSCEPNNGQCSRPTLDSPA